MKIIKLNTYKFEGNNFTGILILSDNVIRFYKKGFVHKNDAPAIKYLNDSGAFYYQGICHGYTDDFNIKWWKKKVKKLKGEEKLKIFL